METEYRLSKTQQRMVIALVRERELIASQANEQILEINQAIDELAREIGAKANMPIDGRLEFRRDNPQDPLVLVSVPKEEKSEGG